MPHEESDVWALQLWICATQPLVCNTPGFLRLTYSQYQGDHHLERADLQGAKNLTGTHHWAT